MSESALPASLARFRGELEEAIRRELEADASARANGRIGRVLHAVRRRPGRTVVAFAAVAGAATAALFVSTPWQSSPRLGFLEEVQAAIAPQAGKVLHYKVVMTQNAGGCKVTQPPIEYWQDLTPPYNYRGLEVQQDDICTPGYSIEVGGEAHSAKPLLRFVPPDTLTPSHIQYDADIGPDPMADLRQAIEDGFAHREGRTVLDDGRTVERIRQDCDRAKFPLCRDPRYVYVDPETFKPVRGLSGPALYPRPDGSCSAPCWTVDVVTYEYLDGTPGNRALADIRAQHPDAIER
jgi:hypothetical protein